MHHPKRWVSLLTDPTTYLITVDVIAYNSNILELICGGLWYFVHSFMLWFFLCEQYGFVTMEMFCGRMLFLIVLNRIDNFIFTDTQNNYLCLDACGFACISIVLVKHMKDHVMIEVRWSACHATFFYWSTINKWHFYSRRKLNDNLSAKMYSKSAQQFNKVSAEWHFLFYSIYVIFPCGETNDKKYWTSISCKLSILRRPNGYGSSQS